MADQGFGLPAPLPAFSGWRRWGLPEPALSVAEGFLADLRSHALLQRLRWTHRRQAQCSTRGVAFPLHVQGRRPQKVISELFTQPTLSLSTLHLFGCHLAVYASPLRLPSRRKTRFRLAATLGRTGLIPARSVRKASKTPLSSLTHVISSPFPRLRLAHTWHLSWHLSAFWHPSWHLNLTT